MTPDDLEDKHMGGGRDSSLVERAMLKDTQRPHGKARDETNRVPPVPVKKDKPVSPVSSAHFPPSGKPVHGTTESVVVESLRSDSHGTEVRPESRSRTVELDFDLLRANGFVTPQSTRTRTTEEFRFIKRTLLQGVAAARAAGSRNPNLIMVTSALPSEGKTFNAVNLAISIASEPDLNTLLVDADLLMPSVFESLGIESGRGLIDVIDNRDENLSDALVKTNIEGMSLLGAGTPHLMATELLASDDMRRFVNEIAQRYDDRIIIFDAPPVLITSEPSVLATHMSQVIFVIEAERTSQSQVKEALDLIGPGPNIGLVLNKARSQFGAKKYGSYYKSYSNSR